MDSDQCQMCEAQRRLIARLTAKGHEQQDRIDELKAEVGRLKQLLRGSLLEAGSQ